MHQITLDDFNKIEIRVGKVVKAENVEKSEKLIRLVVDFGPAFAKASTIVKTSADRSAGEAKRIIFTGVRKYGYTPEDFSDRQFLFVTNIPCRKMPSYAKASDGKMVQEESQGMILAVDGLELPFGEHGPIKPLFIKAEGLPVGSKVR